MRKLIAILLMIALTMALAGCAGGDTEPTVRETLPRQAETTEQATTQTLPAQTESSVPATTQTEATEPSQPEQTDALTALRARMQKELIAGVICII